MDSTQAPPGQAGRPVVTGRIGSDPDDVIRTEVLLPQLRFEVAALLPWYVQVERVLLLEYRRMGLMDGDEVAAVARALDAVTAEGVLAAAAGTMSDVAFGVERFVGERLAAVPVAWHVDRSRNDLQATAQMLYGRSRLLDVADGLLALARAAVELGGRTADVPMPGYTHLQPAQVISPGFYLAGVADQVLATVRRLQAVYLDASSCPLGAGAMAGQELPWDRERMAGLLGCRTVRRHALRAVAQRDWALTACAEFSLFGVAASRFVTDLMTWGSGEYGFVELPDAWAGISSAMPQKRNYPVLERIRARTAHLTAAYVDVATAQRSTPFTNSVEVSKEAGAGVPAAFDTMSSVLRLLTGVLSNLTFHEEPLRAACARGRLGGFTLANRLTLAGGVPWRTAQVVAGRFLASTNIGTDIGTDTGHGAEDAALLERLLAEAGHPVTGCAELLEETMDVDAGLRVKRGDGSTHPDDVRRQLADAEAELGGWERRWQACRAEIAAGEAEIARLLAPDAVPSDAGHGAGSRC